MLGKYQSGQMGQTVNLLAYAFGGSNPSLPTENQIVFERSCLIFCFYIGLFNDQPENGTALLTLFVSKAEKQAISHSVTHSECTDKSLLTGHSKNATLPQKY